MSKSHAVTQLVEALRYKTEGREFDSGGVIGIFHRLNPCGRNTALGSTQPLIETSNRNISWELKAAVAYRLHVPTVLKSGSVRA
jgi:hypothetical protein